MVTNLWEWVVQGVALINGGMESYYNPALLAPSKSSFKIQMQGGMSLTKDSIKHTDFINDFEMEKSFDNISDELERRGIESLSDRQSIDLSNKANDIQGLFDYTDVLKAINDKEEIFSVSHYAYWHIGGFSIGYDIALDTKIKATFDGFDLIAESDTDDEIIYIKINKDNTVTKTDKADYDKNSIKEKSNTRVYSYLNYITQIPISYGQEIEIPWFLENSLYSENLYIGGSLNYILHTGLQEAKEIDPEEGIDVLSPEGQRKVRDSLFENATVGVDIGVLYEDKRLPDLNMGLVIKNLNSPASGDYKMPMMVRTGVSYQMDNVDMALDIDLTKNSDNAQNPSQYIGGGVGINYDLISLYGGSMYNLPQSKLYYTTGIKLLFDRFSFDMALKTDTFSFDENAKRDTEVLFSMSSVW